MDEIACYVRAFGQNITGEGMYRRHSWILMPFEAAKQAYNEARLPYLPTHENHCCPVKH